MSEEHARPIRKFRVRRRWLTRAAIGLGALAAVGTGFGVHYGMLLRAASEKRAVEEENAQLRAQMRVVEDRIGRIASTLERVERFDQKLQLGMTQLQSPERSLAIGPVGKGEEASAAAKVSTPGGSSQRSGAAAASSEPRSAPLPGAASFASLQKEAVRQESALGDLHAYFGSQVSLLASTPSVWPTRGWVTSDFGERLDPYTAVRVMHKGLDIATPHGQPVYSPSAGTVVAAGSETGYGKVAEIDHGYGVKTRYGHLSELYVKAGERVKQGAPLGAVGNTGRSTGPHLHYEVRVNGVPENPRKFILE